MAVQLTPGELCLCFFPLQIKTLGEKSGGRPGLVEGARKLGLRATSCPRWGQKPNRPPASKRVQKGDFKNPRRFRPDFEAPQKGPTRTDMAQSDYWSTFSTARGAPRYSISWQEVINL